MGKRRKALTDLERFVLNLLRKLGYKVDVTTLRFETKFKYTSKQFTWTLRALKGQGLVGHEKKGGSRVQGLWWAISRGSADRVRTPLRRPA